MKNKKNKAERLNVVNVLTKARELMEHHWIQGSFVQKVSGVWHYCAMGGIDEAVARLNGGVGLTSRLGGTLPTCSVEQMGDKDYRKRLKGTPRTPIQVAGKAVRYLQRAASVVRGRSIGVVAFNDSVITDNEDILCAFDIAIKAAKSRHLPAIPSHV